LLDAHGRIATWRADRLIRHWWPTRTGPGILPAAINEYTVPVEIFNSRAACEGVIHSRSASA
jgi:hypothetical protein